MLDILNRKTSRETLTRIKSSYKFSQIRVSCRESMTLYFDNKEYKKTTIIFSFRDEALTKQLSKGLII